MLTVAASSGFLVAAWICATLTRNTFRVEMGWPLFVAVVPICATSGARVELDSLKLPSAAVVVLGSPGSQAPLPFRSKHTVRRHRAKPRAGGRRSRGGVSEHRRGEQGTSTTPLTMDTEAKAEVEHSASALATAAATREGRSVLNWDCMFSFLPE